MEKNTFASQENLIAMAEASNIIGADIGKLAAEGLTNLHRWAATKVGMAMFECAMKVSSKIGSVR